VNPRKGDFRHRRVRQGWLCSADTLHAASDGARAAPVFLVSVLPAGKLLAATMTIGSRNECDLHIKNSSGTPFASSERGAGQVDSASHADGVHRSC